MPRRKSTTVPANEIISESAVVSEPKPKTTRQAKPRTNPKNAAPKEEVFPYVVDLVAGGAMFQLKFRDDSRLLRFKNAVGKRRDFKHYPLVIVDDAGHEFIIKDFQMCRIPAQTH